jgi:uncharacterized short protein YbdD (DUF466 family)
MKLRTLAVLSARAWAWLRAVSGDDAYEAYVAYVAKAAHPGAAPTPEEFYLDGLRRKYARINRCC